MSIDNHRRVKRIGEVSVTRSGLKMKIIEYRNNKDIDIMFEDNTILRERDYTSFRNGSIAHPSMKINGFLSSFNIEKEAFRGINPEDVFYICECTKCNLSNILNPKEMIIHKCGDDNYV